MAANLCRFLSIAAVAGPRQGVWSLSTGDEQLFTAAAAAGARGAGAGPGGRHHTLGAEVPGGEHYEAVRYGCCRYRRSTEVRDSVVLQGNIHLCQIPLPGQKQVLV